MIMLGSLIFVAGVIFWLWAIYDSAIADKARVRNLPKMMWVVIIVLFFEIAPFAALAWVLFGRPRRGDQIARTESARGALGGNLTRGLSGSFFDGTRSDRSGSRGGGGFGSTGADTSRKPAPKRPVGPDDDPDFLSKL